MHRKRIPAKLDEDTPLRLDVKIDDSVIEQVSSHKSLVYFFDVVLHDYNVKLPSYTSFVGDVVCAHQSFVACVPVRFCFSLPLILTLLMASISHFLTANFHVFPPTKIVSFFLFSSFFVFHVSIDIKIWSNSTLLLYLSLKSLCSHVISSQKTSCCIWVAIPVDWVILYWRACGADGRAYGHVTTKYSRMHRVCCIEMIRISISDPRSLGSWSIKCTDDSLSRADSSVHSSMIQAISDHWSWSG